MCRAKAGIERKLSTPAFSFSHNKNFSQGDLKENQVALFLFHRKELSPMPLFTTKPTDQLFERFMKHQPNFKPDAPEADRIQAELDAEKERKETRAMIYRDERHEHTFEKEVSMRPDSVSRALLAALYLLTADRNLWNQVRDHISLRRVYVEDMRPKNLTGTSYVYFAAAKDILSGTRNIQLMEIADPALLSMKSYMILCTALAIRAYGVERASRIQFEARWE